MARPWKRPGPGGSFSLTPIPTNPLGEMSRWVMTDHPACTTLGDRKDMEIGGKQKMRRGTGRVYRIVVRSELSTVYAGAFEGMEMEARDGDTVLTGRVIDQPQLYGILERINGLGLELLSVEALPEGGHSSVEEKIEPKGPEL